MLPINISLKFVILCTKHNKKGLELLRHDLNGYLSEKLTPTQYYVFIYKKKKKLKVCVRKAYK